MKKLKGSSIARLEDDAAIEEYYKDAALESLLYWANSTSALAGNNATVAFLTEMLATCITNLVPGEQAPRAKEIIFKMLNESFALIENGTEREDKSDLN